MKLSDFYESMQGYTPVNAGIPPAPVAPNPHTQVSPYLRTTLPLPLQYSGDTVKQYHRPGLSSFRAAPLPPAGIPTVVSTAAGVTKVVTQNGGSGLLLETDGVVNANQSILNIIGTGSVTATSDANGGVTLNGTSSPIATGIPRPNTRRFSILDFTPALGSAGYPGGVTFIGTTEAPIVSGTGGGTWPNGPSTTDGMYLQLTSSALGTIGASGYITTSTSVTNPASYIVGRNLMMQFRARFPTTGDMSNAINWVALTDNYGGAATGISGIAVPAAANILGFVFKGTQWFGVTQTGGTQTAVALAGGADTTSHTFEALMDDVAGTATFFIDGVQVGVSSTNMPASGTQVAIFAGAANTNHMNQNMNLEYFYIERDF